MHLHRNAALGLSGRRRLVELVAQGHSLRQAARMMGVAPATSHRWWHRWIQAPPGERASLACLGDRSSRPRRQPRRLDEEAERAILVAREQTNLGPARLAHLCRRPPSTIWKVLRRHGRSRRRRGPAPAARRYEWTRSGALVHVDTARLARFSHPGHRTRPRGPQARNEGLGYVYVHVAVDDRSRYAYCEQHPDERGPTCARFLERALSHFAEAGLGPPEAVMTDGARSYRCARVFQEVLRAWGVRHILTPPYTPRWNGKACVSASLPPPGGAARLVCTLAA